MRTLGAINSKLSKLGIRVIKSCNHELISKSPHIRSGSRWLKNSVNPSLINYIKENIVYSNAQLEQDLFVAWTIQKASEMNIPQSKFFVEFGATNGYKLSNTFFLEKYLNWDGILAEPAKSWHDELMTTRKCRIDKRCVFTKTGEIVDFTITKDKEFATISKFELSDSHSQLRINGEKLEVETVSLQDLLKQNHAPRNIGYLSIDTEGSEYEILKNFDFSSYEFSVITIEHNFTPKRVLIYKLLSSNGYARVLEHVSDQDDWYVQAALEPLFI